VGDVRFPWWTLPGVGAMVGTLVVVGAAQGALSAAHVALPREVQVAGARPQPYAGPAPTSTTTPAGDRVIAPSRPVVSESTGEPQTLPSTVTVAGPEQSTGPGPGAQATGVASSGGSEPVGTDTESDPPTEETAPVPTTTVTTPIVSGADPPTTTSTTRPGGSSDDSSGGSSDDSSGGSSDDSSGGSSTGSSGNSSRGSSGASSGAWSGTWPGRSSSGVTDHAVP